MERFLTPLPPLRYFLFPLERKRERGGCYTSGRSLAVLVCTCGARTDLEIPVSNLPAYSYVFLGRWFLSTRVASRTSIVRSSLLSNFGTRGSEDLKKSEREVGSVLHVNRVLLPRPCF